MKNGEEMNPKDARFKSLEGDRLYSRDEVIGGGSDNDQKDSDFLQWPENQKELRNLREPASGELAARNE